MDSTLNEHTRHHEISEMWKRIMNQDYEAVFAHGGCYYFALRLHERFGYTIRGIKEEQTANPTHVWCIKTVEGPAVDIRGVYSEDVIGTLAGPHCTKPCEIGVAEIRRIINSRGYPTALDAKIRELADWIVDSHERFETAKPIDSGFVNRCLKELIE
jgi:hypothetical protein